MGECKYILITGRAGFIGSHLGDELLNCGYRVRALDYGCCSAVLLFVCVLLHELSHSYVAQKSGIAVPKITLFISESRLHTHLHLQMY
jgi:UDP-glucose 4-epimerase